MLGSNGHVQCLLSMLLLSGLQINPKVSDLIYIFLEQSSTCQLINQSNTKLSNQESWYTVSLVWKSKTNIVFAQISTPQGITIPIKPFPILLKKNGNFIQIFYITFHIRNNFRAHCDINYYFIHKYSPEVCENGGNVGQFVLYFLFLH